MPDTGPMVLYRLRDHIAGVNWRPTRFAEAVPNIRICDLCSTIPKKTVILPCAHILCESCHRAGAQDGGGMCPLEGNAFTEDECVWSPLSERIAKEFKAHCWNQPHGCEFVATMDAVLRHYEAECTFHTVECKQCGVAVLHNEMVGHHVAGCTGGTPLPTANHGDAVTMGDVRAAVEELKAFVRDPHHNLLPALQSQMNQLMEQCRQDDTRVMEAIHLLTQSTDDIKGEVTRIASTAQSVHSREGSQEEAGAGISGDGFFWESISWRTEKMLILRRLEVFAKHTMNALEQLRQSSQPDGTPGIPFTIKPLDDRERLSDASYSLCHEFKLSNAHDVLSDWDRFELKEKAHQYVWDQRDRFFKVTFVTFTTSSADMYPTANLGVRLECFSICSLAIGYTFTESPA